MARHAVKTWQGRESGFEIAAPQYYAAPRSTGFAMLPVYINGKFYSGGLNGVHRVADRLIREIDARLGKPGTPPVTLLLPRRVGSTEGMQLPALRNIRLQEIDTAPSQAWEQTRLPGLSADGVLVNLANLAPLQHRRKITLIHDAQFLFPDNSYPLRQRLGYRLLVPRMARSSAIVLTVSEYSRRTLDVTCVSPAGRTAVLYNGANHVLEVEPDGAILPQLGLTPRGYTLMFGSPKAYKNNAVVFAAYAGRAPEGAPLVIVGAAREGLEAAGLAVPPDAVFAGKCDDAQLRALYEGARCLLCPSRTEGFGLPPLEAMLCGTPAIVAPAGALPEICRDAALYADVDDPGSWSRAIAALDPEAPLHARKVAEGLERARHFSWTRAGTELLDTILALSDREWRRAA
ncbi:glycosyltransferase family 1 protein [Novosphingobium resinovorum]|uniref:glycosyltransferase family 4 protein n=1 Tax=Novosphingobium resinovorum TaxID=158500 RepID=UPI002ED21098|nr:glycosyltransferase family 1 protein [Novosphingobium resinovorum]